MPIEAAWSFVTPAPIRTRPISTDTHVVLRTANAVTAVDANAGTQIWSYPASSNAIPDSLIKVQGDRVVFASDLGKTINAVKLTDGTLLWQVTRGFFEGGIDILAVDESRMYAKSGRSGYIWAYSLKDGTLSWQSPQLNSSFVSIQPRGNELYLLNSLSLIVLDSKTGQIKRELANKFEGADPTIVDDVVLQQLNGNLLARDLGTGAIRWQFPRPLNGYLGYYNVIENAIYATVECCSVVALEKRTGQLLWQKKFDAEIVSPVAVLKGNGYIMLADGSIKVFQLLDGANSGQAETARTHVSPFYGDKGFSTNSTSLYATFGDNTLLAFER